MNFLEAVSRFIKERNQPRVEFIDLFDMSVSQETELTQLINDNARTAQVWMHTHFDENADTQNSNEEFIKYTTFRTRMISAGQKYSMPIIAFIEDDPQKNVTPLEEYTNYYAALAPTSRTTKIYLVRTYDSDPTPIIVRSNYYYPRERNIRNKNWGILAERLKDLGIGRVILRGRNFWMDSYYVKHLDQGQQLFAANFGEPLVEFYGGGSYVNLPAGCVGHTFVQLKARGLNVLLSRITYPEVLSKLST